MLQVVHTIGATVLKRHKDGITEQQISSGDLIPGYRTNFRHDVDFYRVCDVVYKDTLLQEIPVEYLELSSEEEAFKKGFTAGYHVIQVHGKLVTGGFMDMGPPLAGETELLLPDQVVTLEPDKVYDCQVGGEWGDKHYMVALHGHMNVLLSKEWFVFIDPDDYPMEDGRPYTYTEASPSPPTTTYSDDDIPF